MSSDDPVDLWRSADEPPDGWRPSTPTFEDGLGMEVVPTDLEHFAQMVGADHGTYEAALDSAISELAIGFPNFSGLQLRAFADEDDAPPPGAMSEGWAFQRTYLQVWSMFYLRLQHVKMGLSTLAWASAAAHVAYGMADAFAVADDGPSSDPFSEEDGYHPDFIDNLFAEPPTPDGGEPTDLTEAAEEQWEAFAEQMEDDGRWSDGSAVLVGDSDFRLAETRHEGQDGEYTLPRDQNRVDRGNQASDLQVFDGGMEDANPEDVAVRLPSPPRGSDGL